MLFLLALLLALVPLHATAGPPPESRIGRQYWMGEFDPNGSSIGFAAKADDGMRFGVALSAGQTFVIEGVDALGTSSTYYRVKADDGRTLYLPAEALDTDLVTPTNYGGGPSKMVQHIFAGPPDQVRAEAKRRQAARAAAAAVAEKARQDAAAAAEAARLARGPARIGMTKEQVLASSWGRPRDVVRSTTAAGTVEQWFYGGHNLLEFDNGKLVRIQD